jgi:hypothetical protein
MNKYYGPQGKMFWNYEHWNRNYDFGRTNTVEIIRNGIVNPVMCRGAEGTNWFNRVDVGIMRPNWEYVTGSNMWGQTERLYYRPSDFTGYMPFINSRVVWGGEIIKHYGHFLIQSTARIYYYLQHKDEFDGIVFCWCFKERIPQYVFEFLKLAGIGLDKVAFVNRIIKFREIAVPSMSSFYMHDWTPEYLIPFKIAGDNVKPAEYEKIYFTRTKMRRLKSKCFGEDKLEELFRKNGFKVIAPETLPLSKQIALVKGAKVIAGINGTALHNIFFCAGQTERKTIIQLNRTEVFNIQFLINQALGNVDMMTVKAYDNFLPVSHADGPFIMGLTDELRDCLKDMGLSDFNMPSLDRKKFAEQFLEYYRQIYSQTDFYGDLKDQSGTEVEVGHLLTLLNAINKKHKIRNWFRRCFKRVADIFE